MSYIWISHNKREGPAQNISVGCTVFGMTFVNHSDALKPFYVECSMFMFILWTHHFLMELKYKGICPKFMQRKWLMELKQLQKSGKQALCHDLQKLFHSNINCKMFGVKLTVRPYVKTNHKLSFSLPTSHMYNPHSFYINLKKKERKKMCTDAIRILIVLCLIKVDTTGTEVW